MLKRAAARLVSLVLPPRCPGCGTPVGEDHRFCGACWSSLRFVGPPWCAGCNVPLAYDGGPGTRCAACLADPPRHAGIRAAVAYGDVARGLALRLKYARRTGAARTMAAAMMRVMPLDIELMVPVPLHRWRLWRRGFNQAALIAEALARRSGARVELDALVRHRSTAPLKGLNGRTRRQAVAGALSVRRDKAGTLKGRHIGLVDDVFTSGATAEACVGALLAAGAERVTVLCWARVLPDEAGD